MDKSEKKEARGKDANFRGITIKGEMKIEDEGIVRSIGQFLIQKLGSDDQSKLLQFIQRYQERQEDQNSSSVEGSDKPDKKLIYFKKDGIKGTILGALHSLGGFDDKHVIPVKKIIEVGKDLTGKDLLDTSKGTHQEFSNSAKRVIAELKKYEIINEKDKGYYLTEEGRRFYESVISEENIRTRNKSGPIISYNPQKRSHSDNNDKREDNNNNNNEKERQEHDDINDSVKNSLFILTLYFLGQKNSGRTSFSKKEIDDEVQSVIERFPKTIFINDENLLKRDVSDDYILHKEERYSLSDKGMDLAEDAFCKCSSIDDIQEVEPPKKRQKLQSKENEQQKKSQNRQKQPQPPQQKQLHPQNKLSQQQKQQSVPQNNRDKITLSYPLQIQSSPLQQQKQSFSQNNQDKITLSYPLQIQSSPPPQQQSLSHNKQDQIPSLQSLQQKQPQPPKQKTSSQQKQISQHNKKDQIMPLQSLQLQSLSSQQQSSLSSSKPSKLPLNKVKFNSLKVVISAGFKDIFGNDLEKILSAQGIELRERIIPHNFCYFMTKTDKEYFADYLFVVLLRTHSDSATMVESEDADEILKEASKKGFGNVFVAGMKSETRCICEKFKFKFIQISEKTELINLILNMAKGILKRSLVDAIPCDAIRF